MKRNFPTLYFFFYELTINMIQYMRLFISETPPEFTPKSENLGSKNTNITHK